MAKDFLEVFPTLHIAEPLRDLLGLVKVEKVSSSSVSPLRCFTASFSILT